MRTTSDIAEDAHRMTSAIARDRATCLPAARSRRTITAEDVRSLDDEA